MATLAPADEPREGDDLLHVRLSGPPERIAEALAALRLVVAVVGISDPFPNRRGGGRRVYLRATGLTPEARRFLAGRGAG